ncbi:MAG: hypothetical protein K0U84_02545 [Actinomycetia bacterium]|nr:hypothetical protein [Actinomycetes bacterium]
MSTGALADFADILGGAAEVGDLAATASSLHRCHQPIDNTKIPAAPVSLPISISGHC